MTLYMISLQTRWINYRMNARIEGCWLINVNWKNCNWNKELWPPGSRQRATSHSVSSIHNIFSKLAIRKYSFPSGGDLCVQGDNNPSTPSVFFFFLSFPRVPFNIFQLPEMYLRIKSIRQVSWCYFQQWQFG